MKANLVLLPNAPRRSTVPKYHPITSPKMYNGPHQGNTEEVLCQFLVYWTIHLNGFQSDQRLLTMTQWDTLEVCVCVFYLTLSQVTISKYGN